jgi:hypothetical protein
VTGLTSLTSTTVVTDAINGSSANGPITIAPDGTGDVHLNTDSVRIGDNNADATLATRGTGDLILTTNEGSVNEGIIRIYDGINGNITLTPNGTGKVVIDGLNYPTADGTNNQVLKTDGAGNLTFTTISSGGITDLVQDTTPQLGGSLDVNGQSIVSVSNGHIQLVPNGTGNIMLTPTTGQIILGATNYPTSTPTTGQVLTASNGAGQLTWSTPSSFAAASPGEIGATTPDIGNFTTLNVKAGNELRLADSDSSNYVGFKSPTTVSTNKVWVLPNADGTNGQVLSTNGSATLSWVTAGGGGAQVATFNTLYNNYQSNDGTYRIKIQELSDPNNLITLSNGDFQMSLGAGSYSMIFDFQDSQYFANPTMYNITDSTAIGDTMWKKTHRIFTLSGTKSIDFRTSLSNDHIFGNTFTLIKFA